MSIWATQWDAQVPARTIYGQPTDGQPTDVYVCTSGMSDALRLSIDDAVHGVVVYLLPDEARELATALLAAAESTDKANVLHP